MARDEEYFIVNVVQHYPGRGQKILSAPEPPRPALGLTQPPIQWIPVFCPADKTAG